MPDPAAGLFAPPRPLFCIAVLFCAFQIVTAAYSPLPSQIVRAVHVGFLVLLVFGMAAERTDTHGVLPRAALWTAGAVAFVLALYHWVFQQALILRSGAPTEIDIAIGCATLALLFDAARRVMGWPLPLICLSFFVYALFGEHLPAPLAHRGYGFDQVIDQYAFGTEGIYGIPTYVSSTYIFLFILFGSFLEQAGMVRLFTDVALGTVGHTKGGPAKVSVVTSALMGTINGSGVANVVTTGQFTIPLMKRFGYRAEFAGAVEATSSMGGQIMPPVMGAVAFIMAETLNISYAQVCIAAIVPALLYFVTALWMVHLEAGRRNLVGLEKAACPKPLAALRRQGHLIIPLVVLVLLLFSGYTPLFSGTVGLALTVVLILATNLSASLTRLLVRIGFWIALAGLCTTFFKFGITPMLAVIGLLSIASLFAAGGRATLWVAVRGMVEGARNALAVGIACALVGVIIGTMTLTGLAGVFTHGIVALGRDNLFFCLLLTMLVCLVLGMGIPTIPNYIIVSSLVAPVLLKLGAPLLVSHMFVFYFGIMADLTPPVALAVFAASAIARSSPMRTGIEAVRIAIAGFVVPFMAVYDPALLLLSDDATDIGYVIVKALLAITLWGAAAIGHLILRLLWWERLLAAAGAFFLVAAVPITDEIGFAVAVSVIILHTLRSRRRAALSPPS
ncbi:MAG: TRAP transporter permease [Rhodospirillales bacterium]|nr:TRAP transporter permease [Rhodospirillales bacterium]